MSVTQAHAAGMRDDGCAAAVSWLMTRLVAHMHEDLQLRQGFWMFREDAAQASVPEESQPLPPPHAAGCS